MTRSTRLGIIGGLLLAALAPGVPASAATVTVTSSADSGAGSLRAAILAAAPGDTIAFSLPVPATITLTSGSLYLGDDVTITGLGPSLITIRRDAGSDQFSIFYVAYGVTAGISGVTISGGGSAWGAAVSSTGVR